MAIEAIKSAGVTYQGSSSTAEMRTEAQPKVEAAEQAVVSNKLQRDTIDLTTKQKGGEHMGSDEEQQSQQNAQIKKTVEQINKRANNSEAVFGVHEDTNRVTIKIVDKKTKETIKEFPPEETLDMIAKVWEMAGLMVDERR